MKVQQIKKYTVMEESGETIDEAMVVEGFKGIGEVVVSFRNLSTDPTAIFRIFVVETSVYTEVK